jgi:uncharacterized protein
MNSQHFATLAALMIVGINLIQSASGQSPPGEKPKIRVLIVDGFNPYHDWQKTTPLMKQILEGSGRFTVDVATAPIPEGYKCGVSEPPPPVDNRDFHPKFANYDVVIGNYVGPRWPKETEDDFVAFVKNGGGFVSVHSADNAFADWSEYNQICGIGGWYGRDEKWGPYVFFDDAGNLQHDATPGRCGHHGPKHEYQVEMRDTQHPITRGLPPLWMHTSDELYDSLRGPAENMSVLATAYSDPKFQGTGRHEPMLMTLEYGKGRVFHTVIGHNEAMKCVGFATTLARGTEWAATGNVTIPVPANFPTADEVKTNE